MSPQTQALLGDPDVALDDADEADLRAGRIDPRVVAVLAKLAETHTVTVSGLCSNFPKFTSGGSISTHDLGRAGDVAAIDGVPISAANLAARGVAESLASLPASYRPDEVGSPWPIATPGYFTDAEHQDHIHIGFKEPIEPTWTPPAG